MGIERESSDSTAQTRDLTTQTGKTPSAPEQSVKPFWQIGDVILDLYQVTALLGEGGMGRVYKVRHKEWNMDLAVKSPRPEIFTQMNGKQNFIREAEVWVNLGSHPHIVTCYYVRNLEGIPLVFAECIEGGSLSHWIRDRRLFKGSEQEVLERILDVAIQFAWGLDYAHQEGLVHQDVKPANVLLDLDGIAKVSDFGLSVARALAGEVGNPNESVFVSSGGMTPAYCSPEQAEGHSLTRKTDIWSWAVSILEMFYGKPPCRFGPSAPEALQTYLEEGTVDLLKMPGWLADLLFQCFKKDSRERPRTLTDIAEILLKGYRETTGNSYHREQPSAADLKADALNNRAMSLMDIGRLHDTEEILESALKTDPYHPEATFNHCILAWRQGKMTDLDVLSRVQMTSSKEFYQKADQARSIYEETNFPFTNVLAVNLKEKLVALRTDYLQFRILSLIPGKRDLVLNDESEGGMRIIGDGAFDWASRYFITSDFEGFSIWDLESQKKQRCEGLPKKLRISMLLPPVLLKDQRILYASSETVFLWPPNKSEPIPFCVGHFDNIHSICTDSNEQQILTASHDGTVRIWRADSGVCEYSYNISSSPVLFACFSPDGKMIVACGRDGLISFWQSDGSRRKVMEFSTHPGFITNATVHPFAKAIAVWEESWSQETRSIRSGIIRIYHLDPLRCLRSFPGLNRKLKGQLQFSDDGETLFAHSEAIGLKSFRFVGAGKPASWEICRPKSSMTLIAIQKECKQRLMEARHLLLDANFPAAHDFLRKAVASFPDYRFDEEITDLFRTVHSYGKPISLAGSWCTHAYQSKNLAPVTAVRFLSGLSWITGTSEGTLQLWDVDKTKDPITLKGHSSAIKEILKASTSARLLTLDAQNNLRAWDLLNQKCVAYFDCSHRENIFEALFLSNDGTKAFSSDKQELIYIWDLEIEELDRTIPVPKQHGLLKAIRCVKDRVLLEFQHGWIDLDSGEEVAPPTANKAAPFHFKDGKISVDSRIIAEEMLSFDTSEDERYLVCGNEAGQIQLWELDWNLSFDLKV